MINLKSNIFIACLINDYGITLAKEVASKVGYNFYNLSGAINLPQINLKSDLNKLVRNSNLIKISNEQLKIVGELKNTIFYSDNFNLFSQNNLSKLKQTCIVVYVQVDKNAYLEHEWQKNINTSSKFKVDIKVFETRDKAYISCAEVVIKGEENLASTASKLIKKLEKV